MDEDANRIRLMLFWLLTFYFILCCITRTGHCIAWKGLLEILLYCHYYPGTILMSLRI